MLVPRSAIEDEETGTRQITKICEVHRLCRSTVNYSSRLVCSLGSLRNLGVLRPQSRATVQLLLLDLMTFWNDVY